MKQIIDKLSHPQFESRENNFQYTVSTYLKDGESILICIRYIYSLSTTSHALDALIQHNATIAKRITCLVVVSLK